MEKGLELLYPNEIIFVRVDSGPFPDLHILTVELASLPVILIL
jgi:hypothetical protein